MKRFSLLYLVIVLVSVLNLHAEDEDFIPPDDDDTVGNGPYILQIILTGKILDDGFYPKITISPIPQKLFDSALIIHNKFLKVKEIICDSLSKIYCKKLNIKYKKYKKYEKEVRINNNPTTYFESFPLELYQIVDEYALYYDHDYGSINDPWTKGNTHGPDKIIALKTSEIEGKIYPGKSLNKSCSYIGKVKEVQMTNLSGFPMTVSIFDIIPLWARPSTTQIADFIDSLTDKDKDQFLFKLGTPKGLSKERMTTTREFWFNKDILLKLSDY